MQYWEAYFQQQNSTMETDYDGWLRAYDALLQPGRRVLDLGCGSGANIPALLQQGVQVTAADLSEHAVGLIAAAYPAVETVCFDMTATFPFPAGRFDVVVADLSLHYFSWADTRKIIGEIRRILKKNGRLIARLHSIQNLDCAPETQIESHYYLMYGYPRRYFTPEEIPDLFSEWRLAALQEKAIRRYNRTKHVIEFVAEKL